MSAYSTAILAHSSLRSYYRLDEPSGTATDLGPGAVTGTYDAAVTRSQQGLISRDSDTAAGFTAGSVVSLGDNYDFTGTVSFSVECWVKLSSAPTTSHNVLSKVAGGNLGGFILRYDNGVNARYFAIRIDNAGTQDFTNGPNTYVAVGTTVHLAVTYDGTNFICYTNGVSGGGATSTLSIPNHANSFQIGGQGGGTGTEGTIDEVAIYNAALTPAEVLAHYVLGAATVTNTVVPTITGNLAVGGTLTANPGTWAPTPAGYNYYWHREDDALGTNLVEIGATGSTYTLASADLNKFIRAGVIPTY